MYVYLKEIPDQRIIEILNIHESPNNISLVIVSTKNAWQNPPSKSHALIEEMLLILRRKNLQ